MSDINKVVRYDKRIVRIIQKLRNLFPELIEKIYNSEDIFYLIDDYFELRMESNSVLIHNQSTQKE